MKIASKFLLLPAFLCASVSVRGQSISPAADHIYFNAKVWTADESKPLAAAFATRAERIVGVGTKEEMQSLASTETAMVDLHGHLVVPGFNDAHWHFATLRDVELDGAATLTEMQELLAT